MVPVQTSATVPDAISDEKRSSGAVVMVVGAGHFAAHRLPIGGHLTLGRDPACDVRLDHPRISRRHAVLHGRAAAARGGVVVEDLGSTNGVVIGKRRLDPGGHGELVLGDSFQVGPFTVVVVGDSELGEGSGPTRVRVVDPTPGGVPAEVARFAVSPVSILIHGETGTGKEVLARTIHQLSGRAPFVGINAAALSEALLESELFGHERGAFTGATQAKPGLFEIAAGGTVFLDEIGDLPLGLQAKLLRVIETREAYRVGGLRPVALDVRFLAATHRELEAEVAAGRFRQDLYYRLNGITLRLAPLRERRGAIARLARGFLAAGAAAAGRSAPQLGLDALVRLAAHDWPGNVRELRAVMERAFLLCDGSVVDGEAILIDDARAPIDADALRAIVRRHAGNVSAIARELSTSRSHVHRLSRRFGISLGDFRAS